MLSGRLKMIASEIEKGKAVADIGSDHGLLAKFLLKEGRAPLVIVTDISPGALKKAQANLSAAGLLEEGSWDSERLSLRLGDGLKVVGDGEADIAVFAGMGGRLIVKLLSEDFAKTKSFAKFIFQPRNGQAALREWLDINGFETEKELLCREKEKICEIIVSRPPGERIELRGTVAAVEECGMLRMSASENDGTGSPLPVDLSRGALRKIEYELPERLITENGMLGAELLLRRMKLNMEIRENIIMNAADDAYERLRALSAENEYLKKIAEKLLKKGIL